jgi:hypothetical protein
LPEPLDAGLLEALEQSEQLLQDEAKNAELAAQLEGLAAELAAAQVVSGRNDAVMQKRQAALSDTLAGIAARLR